ncbi:helicase HerA domain-containing protein [Halovenus marina]|uniref:ATP-binding protein n=1 Tax=Halovenus marina TaxID=3396621 RepID=UPI003F55B4DC
MAETKAITVAETSDGFGGSDTCAEVSLPVVELLTGRGFVTGKSGSGKSNSASVIAENLLDNGFGLLIVDIDGEYYGLKEEYEILHAGADEECDIQVTTDHSEKLASLALEQNVPIILDVSSYLDESEAEDVLTAVARSLFAKAKKQKQPFLLLVEEVHEYIPENGSVGECGRMLIKIGKRGRKHGLGICGISQRPADVKKDFITQCDWLLWHRLTWNNDTRVVKRILDAEYADAVEDLDDGEGFLMTDWSESVRRVQFHRKRTFDAGATPGLEDFERPDLKSVSDDLVSELESISDEREQTENRIAELREQLDKKNSRIAELEAELQDARDLSRMADQFVNALVRQVEGPAPGRTERERMRSDPSMDFDAEYDQPSTDSSNSETADSAATEASANPETEATADAGSEDTAEMDGMDGFAAMMDAAGDGAGADATGVDTADADTAGVDAAPTDTAGVDTAGADTASADTATTDGGTATQSGGGGFSAEAVMETLKAASELSIEDVRDESAFESDDAERVGTDSPSADAHTPVEGTGHSEPLAVRELKADIGQFETKTRKMLEFYAELGPGTPLNAHFAAGGDGDRTRAYAHNRRLRTRGLVEHVGRGRYDYCLREYLSETLDGADSDTIERYAKNIEETVLDT